MTEIFIAIQRGKFYRHLIVGVSDMLDRALELGEQAIAEECDHYHSIDIVRRTLNASIPDAEVTIGTIQPKSTWDPQRSRYRLLSMEFIPNLEGIPYGIFKREEL